MMIYTEITPNPATLKFVTERKLLNRGTRDYPKPEDAENSPLARRLFEFAFVDGVFIAGNFVTVTKAAGQSWEEIIPQVKTALKNYLESGEPIVTDEVTEAPETPADEDEIVTRIKKLLDDNVRPAVAMDGGDVVFDSFEEGVVRLKLQGSCSGCPSSTMTLKMGIEGLLTRMIPEVKEVQSIDG